LSRNFKESAGIGDKENSTDNGIENDFADNELPQDGFRQSDIVHGGFSQAGFSHSIVAKNISYDNFLRPTFDACFLGFQQRKMYAKISMKLIGEHYIYNALAVISILLLLGFDLKRIASQISKVASVNSHRMQLIDCGVHVGVHIIDDTYNANPDSMIAGLNTLSKIKVRGRKIAVLSDMLELGVDANKEHFLIGEYIAKHPIDVVILFGTYAKDVQSGLAKHKNNVNTIVLQNRAKLLETLKKIAKPGDVIFFKASNEVQLFKDVRDYCDEYTSIFDTLKMKNLE
jgi:UDP-N-acetylmuramyl pentapeptide synthase